MLPNVKKHPCFSDDCRSYARVHLPVAPVCNIQCNYCLRKYACVNENRPGVTARLLRPDVAAALCEKASEKIGNLTVAGIAGPGDALADFSAVRETLDQIRKKNIPVDFCLSTNGLNLPRYLPDILALGVKYLTITINAVEAEVGSQIYEYVVWENEILRGKEAFRRLSENQLAGLEMAAAHGMICKVNTVVIPGINEHHVPEIAARISRLGAYIQNLVPLVNVKGTKFADISAAAGDILSLRKRCGKYIRQMEHCQRCRADAVGTLAESLPLSAFFSAENPIPKPE